MLVGTWIKYCSFFCYFCFVSILFMLLYYKITAKFQSLPPDFFSDLFTSLQVFNLKDLMTEVIFNRTLAFLSLCKSIYM